jgi:hypothetical protein
VGRPTRNRRRSKNVARAPRTEAANTAPTPKILSAIAALTKIRTGTTEIRRIGDQREPAQHGDHRAADDEERHPL